MSEVNFIKLKEIKYGSDQYKETVKLRSKILRTPLGLKFSKKELNEENNQFHLVCLRNDKIIACLVLKPHSESKVQMRQVAVAKAFRKKGIGRLLMVFAENFCRKQHYRKIILHARYNVVDFYKKFGYSIKGSSFLEIGLKHYPMEKELLKS